MRIVQAWVGVFQLFRPRTTVSAIPTTNHCLCSKQRQQQRCTLFVRSGLQNVMHFPRTNEQRFYETSHMVSSLMSGSNRPAGSVVRTKLYVRVLFQNAFTQNDKPIGKRTKAGRGKTRRNNLFSSLRRRPLIKVDIRTSTVG